MLWRAAMRFRAWQSTVLSSLDKFRHNISHTLLYSIIILEMRCLFRYVICTVLTVKGVFFVLASKATVRLFIFS